MKYLLTYIEKIAEPLSHIVSDWFNKSVTVRKFSSYLKKARIVPVFKGGDNTVMKNYLTIYIESFITKVMKLPCTALLTCIFEHVHK